MAKLKTFVEKCKKNLLGHDDVGKKVVENNVLTPPSKKARRSRRIHNTITPEKASKEVLRAFSGKPPNVNKKWTKQSIISSLVKLEEQNQVSKVMTKKTFMQKIIDSGKSDYMDPSGICRMFNIWKQTKLVREGGRPSIMKLGETEGIVKQVLSEHTNDSNTFRLKDMKKSFESKRIDEAEANGLDPESIECGISDKTAKAAMVAVAMGDSDLQFTTKKLQTKTESQYQAEHSIMGGYAFATTVLSTHFIEGPRPKHLEKFNPEKLSASALETIEWVKEAYDAQHLHPVNTNLLFSSDDSTMFVFEGATDEKTEEWGWKIIDSTQGDSSVRSDFEVGTDHENSGGLRVRMTFTFTASGLAAPHYVAISGLTADELSIEDCPDGLLAAKVPGLAKEGDDIFKNSFGWLVFLRADGKENESDLSIANKKFIHYNDEVLIPIYSRTS